QLVIIFIINPKILFHLFQRYHHHPHLPYWKKGMTEYHTLLHFAISSGALTRSCFLGQYLHGLRKDQLSIHSLRAKETYLTVCRIQLVQAFKGTPLAVCDPVIREIT